MSTVVAPPLSQGAGYGVVIGLGALFAIGMVGLSRLLFAQKATEDSNDEFTVAKRSLGIGLTAAGVISSWTWSTTLLSSCAVAYQYGVAGAFFYASCNSTQIMIFSNLAIQTKRKAPNAHTFLEIMRIRYGRFVHFSFMFFALAANILVVSSVLLGGAAAINAITGVSIYASLWLLPLGVAAYNIRGGLRATILTDYVHTAIILIILLIFAFKTYATGSIVGSPGKMWELLVAAQIRNQDAPTKDNSYLTVQSLGALKFAILSLLEYTGVVFLDNSFHQKGLAADPSAAVPGYILGGLSWYAMPFTFATTAGLLAVAVENQPFFPTYPRRITEAERSAGLVLPYAAQALLGKGGSGAVLLLMFMSCTSAISAQLVGVSTVLSFDIYKTYIRPGANDTQQLRASHLSVVAFSIFMAAFGSLLHGCSIDLGFIYNMTGIFTGCGLPALVLTFFSDQQNWFAAGASVWIGFFSAVATWLSLAKRFSGELSIASVGAIDPCMYGCIAGIGSAAVVTIVLTLVKPAHYDWASLSAIRIINSKGEEVDVTANDPAYNAERLRRAAYFARGAGAFLFLSLFVLWPLTLYGTGYIFSKPFFRGWVIVSILWAFFAIFNVVVLPIIEGRRLIALVFRSLLGRKAVDHAATGGESDAGESEERAVSSTEGSTPDSWSEKEKATGPTSRSLPHLS